MWTPELVNELRRLHETSMTFTQISAAMGISRCAAIGKAQRIGLTRFNVPRGKQLSENRVAQRKKDAERKRLKRAAFRVLNPPKVARSNKGMRLQFVPRPVNDLRERALHVPSITALEPDQCKFPYGDGPWTFCGHHRVDGKPYCAPHVAYCEGIGTPSERAADRSSRRLAA